MNIQIKRIYEPADAADGQRILVDRLWPRGIKKQDAQLDGWPKALTPSNELRKWYHADPEQRWGEFQLRYQDELAEQQEAVQALKRLAQQGKVTLLTASKQQGHSHADVLKGILEQA
ncbi:MAG: DUF488 domain-containing protein [Acinetobacter sp.]